MAANLKASDVLNLINQWTMQAKAGELDNKSIIHLLNQPSVEAPDPLIEAVEMLLRKKKDSPVRIDPEELDELEDRIKANCGEYV